MLAALLSPDGDDREPTWWPLMTLTLDVQTWLLASTLLAPLGPASNSRVLTDCQKVATY